MKQDPYGSMWLCGVVPGRATRKAQAYAIDLEIQKIIEDARFKAAVVAAKVEIVDDLRRLLLEARRG